MHVSTCTVMHSDSTQPLNPQLACEQALVGDMEATMTQKIAEHDQLEAQIQTEHEEEVKALHQQKQQLARQLDDAKMRYHKLSKEQDQHVRFNICDMHH